MTAPGEEAPGFVLPRPSSSHGWEMGRAVGLDEHAMRGGRAIRARLVARGSSSPSPAPFSTWPWLATQGQVEALAGRGVDRRRGCVYRPAA